MNSRDRSAASGRNPTSGSRGQTRPPAPDTPELAERRAQAPAAQALIKATRRLFAEGGPEWATDKRIHDVARCGSGYLYYVSLRGVTGAAHLDLSDVAARIPRIRAATHLPIGVGFGIRDAESARRVAETADAVVIGSRIIQEIEAGAADQAVSRVKAFLKPIREALDASFTQ